MKRNGKRGFTIVELVVVIAVVAILAAVLIPTFSNIIHKANTSADIHIVKNLNTILASEAATEGKNSTMTEALKDAEENGYTVEKLTPTNSNNEILWDSVNDCFALLEKDAAEPNYCGVTPAVANVANYQYFKIYNAKRTLPLNGNTVKDEVEYSIYLGEGAVADTVTALTVSKGIDVGETDGITSINYTNNSENAQVQDVVIRTNSFDTILTISDSSTQGKIYHYDNLGKLIITDCAMESYHEMGIVGYAELQNGHLAVEENASINLLFANSPDSANLKITNNGTITNAQASSDSVKENATISGVNFNRESGATVSDADIQQSVQETHQSNCEHANVVVSKKAKDPKCTETGLTAEKWCADCHKVLIAQEVVPATGHNYNNDTHTCTNCGQQDPDYNPISKEVENGILKESAFINDETITNAVIPEGVTTIGTQAFKGCANLTSVTIPEGVTTIGNAAFQGCTNLTSVTIPDSVTKIGDSAFYGCSNLTTITIGKGVNSIKVGSGISDSFGRTKLTTITVDPENATYQSVGNALLNKAGTKLILGTASTVIPNTVKIIGNRAFLGREGLTTITIPANVTTIEDYAFSESSLTTIVIPANVTKIGTSAFMSCNSLTTVTLNANITEIATGLFSQCSELANITIPSKVTKIGGSAFSQCKKLTNITIPSSVKTIGIMAFLDSGLTSADIGTLNWKVNGQGITSQLMTAGKLDFAKAAQCLKGSFLNSYNQPVDYSTGTWTR